MSHANTDLEETVELLNVYKDMMTVMHIIDDALLLYTDSLEKVNHIVNREVQRRKQLREQEKEDTKLMKKLYPEIAELRGEDMKLLKKAYPDAKEAQVEASVNRMFASQISPRPVPSDGWLPRNRITPICDGCRVNASGQRHHMGVGGCCEIKDDIFTPPGKIGAAEPTRPTKMKRSGTASDIAGFVDNDSEEEKTE